MASTLDSSPSSPREGHVIVYASLSGMVSFFSNGAIHGCNHHFMLMLLGYSQEELVGQVRERGREREREGRRGGEREGGREGEGEGGTEGKNEGEQIYVSCV